MDAITHGLAFAAGYIAANNPELLKGILGGIIGTNNEEDENNRGEDEWMKMAPEWVQELVKEKKTQAAKEALNILDVLDGMIGETAVPPDVPVETPIMASQPSPGFTPDPSLSVEKTSRKTRIRKKKESKKTGTSSGAQKQDEVESGST